MSSKNVLEKFKFNFCSSDVNDLLNKEDINTIFIATPHNIHAELVIKSLEANKSVFVEKPLAINEQQLTEVIKAKSEFQKPVMVGFNRRFAPISVTLRNELAGAGEPLVVNIRVNAGFIPKEHWTQQPGIGAGRIIGEICHFIDLMQYFTGSEPVRVFAESISTNNDKISPEDNIAVVVKFKDGSLGNLTYHANGDKALPKERIEVSSAGSIGIINDFKDGVFYRDGKARKLKSSGKGHREAVAAFLDAIKNGKDSPIDFRSICLTTLTTYRILDSLSTSLPQNINLDA